MAKKPTNEFFVREDGVVEIALGRGFFALIDADDLAAISQYRWCAGKNGKTHYAYTHTHKRPIRTLAMHRLVLAGVAQIDHANRNGLDNRRCNLRAATHSQNGANSEKRGEGANHFKGVCRWKHCNTFRAEIKVGGRMIYLGSFANEVEAARAYDAAARHHFGQFARCNFGDSYCTAPDNGLACRDAINSFQEPGSHALNGQAPGRATR